MKPNGKYFAVRLLFLGLCTFGLLSASGQAETAHGTFQLPVEAHWGKMVLAPGEYEFSVSDDVAGRVVTVRSRETGSSGMVLPVSWSDVKSATGTMLMLTKSGEGEYVRALLLGDSGVVLNYAIPKPGMSKPEKETRLGKPSPKPAVIASASGGQ